MGSFSQSRKAINVDGTQTFNKEKHALLQTLASRDQLFAQLVKDSEAKELAVAPTCPMHAAKDAVPAIPPIPASPPVPAVPAVPASGSRSARVHRTQMTVRDQRRHPQSARACPPATPAPSAAAPAAKSIQNLKLHMYCPRSTLWARAPPCGPALHPESWTMSNCMFCMMP
ncbi:hypothetical protein CYMTET_35354 [Cymbomonas tetramitiformis]|uniref:Uncharacterized protein n=1 Tax=Cymbomonas tetramitiformis TaxID=36881 RepID=A0AAE0F9B4_9CHLO|nr:hypothetical protein CYMTET_35354 [Cymbomonas tetramitiformis]